MRAHAVTALYALIAISCLGCSFCGLITELGEPFQQADEGVNEVSDILPNANIDPVIDAIQVNKNDAEPVDISSDLNPVAGIISPIPGELGFFHKLIAILTKLLSSVKPNDCEEHKEDNDSTTESVESNETTDALDNENSTVVATEIPIDSDAGESATQAPVEISEYGS
ncbi:uncharacterized protein LOC105219634 [Zeugodacus cucurbitae]|uniref:uncharacterized protein LOC105219634 n=1 Tax=Zeugodacus cucurbitae TaxID=28588 RepID=UPI0023D93C18|nr:uncharacterized protein LOC105219634 [Zeugodacus cucurbitae]